MKANSVLLAALLLLVCALPSRCQEELEIEDDDYAEDESAVLVARKYLDAKEVVVGQKTALVIEFYNSGESAAHDVKVEDSALPSEHFELVDGSLTASFDTIASGSSAKHEYWVVAKKGGLIEAPPASFTYKPEADSKTMQAGKSSAPQLLVVTSLQKYGNQALHVGMYATLGAIRTPQQWQQWAIGIIVLGVLVCGNQGYKMVLASNKARRYQRALSEVEKMQ